MKTSTRVLLSFLSAGLLSLITPPLPTWWVVFFALVPLLIAIHGIPPRKALIYGLITATTATFIGEYWVINSMTLFAGVPYPLAVVATVIMSIFGFFNLVLFSWLARVIQKQKNFSPFLLLPPLFLSLEWLVPKLFPWYLGSFIYPWRVGRQFVDVTGILGPTLVVLLVNVTIYLWIISIKLKLRKPITETIITLLVLTSVTTYGYFRLDDLNSIQDHKRAIKVSIVQTNIGSLQKESAQRGHMEALAFAHRRNEELIIDAGKQKPSLIVLPETAVHGTFTKSKIQQYRMFSVAREVGAYIFFGGYHSELINGKEVDYNTAFLVSPKSEIIGYYNKIQLLLFGEYLPFPNLFIWPQSVKDAVGEFERGKEIKLFPLNGEQIAPLICYEGILPKLVREFVLKGATFFVNVSNDSWFGDTAAPRQHIMLEAWRSVEHRIPIARSTNTGISGFINIFGDITDQIDINEIGISTKEIEIIETKTLYTKYGDWLANIAIIISALFLLIALLNIFRNKSSKY